MNPQEYAVLTSGHGFDFRYDGADPQKPTILLTRDKAFEQACGWVGIADTIGGDALIEHVPTEQRFYIDGEPVPPKHWRANPRTRALASK